MYNADYIIIIIGTHCKKFGKIEGIMENITCKLSEMILLPLESL